MDEKEEVDKLWFLGNSPDEVLSEKGESLFSVPIDSHETEDWVYPTSYDSLYLPADLPSLSYQPALGIAIANGLPRYLMPSIILTAQTTKGSKRIWRNRGMNSLPRAHVWIDVFSENAPMLTSLQYYLLGTSPHCSTISAAVDKERKWRSLLVDSSVPAKQSAVIERLPIQSYFQAFQAFFTTENAASLHEGYHFVDIPLINTPQLFPPSGSVPKQIVGMLTDISEPQRLLSEEENLRSDSEDSVKENSRSGDRQVTSRGTGQGLGDEWLDGEPLGVLQIETVEAAAGGQSPYLPKIYHDLFASAR
eukprot:scaffold2573_cov202-Ochromonas_danica.AAC.2